VGSTWRTGEVGTNIIAGTDPAMIIEAAKCALKNPVDKSGLRTPELWDGHAAERILDTSIEAEQ
jgi:UDP-N-acetylglucosamine 2-epimerase